MSFTMGIMKLLRLCFIIATCPVAALAAFQERFGKFPRHVIEDIFRSPVGSDNEFPDTAFSSWQIGPEFHTLPMEVPRIQVSCTGSQLTLLVEKRFNGVLPSGKDLQLGDDCFSNGDSQEHFVFIYDFAQCGTNHVTQNGMDVFYNLLHFNPRSTLTWWQAPFTVPISCVPNRSYHGPKEFPLSIPLPSMKTDWSFTINAMNPSWTNTAESNLYQRGQSIHLQVLAKCGTDQRPFIQFCWVSSSIAPETRPQHAVILNKGCTAISRSNHTMAQFVPSGRKDAVNVILNTSRLKSGVYIHCSVIISDQGITVGSKSCNYKKIQSRWEELSDNVTVCNCCRSKCKDQTHGNSNIDAMALVSTGPFIVNGEPMRSHPPAPRLERRPHPPAPQPKVTSHSPAPDAEPYNYVDFMQSDEPAAEVTIYRTSASQSASGAQEGMILSERAIPGPHWLPVPAGASVSSQEDPAARLSLTLPGQVTNNNNALYEMPHAPSQLNTNDVAKWNPTATHYNLHQSPPTLIKGMSAKRFKAIGSDTVTNGAPLSADEWLIPILDGWPIPPPPMLYGWPIPPPYHEMAARREEGLKRREEALKAMRDESQRKQALRERERALKEESRRNKEWGRRSRMRDSRALKEHNARWPAVNLLNDLNQHGSGPKLKIDGRAEVGTTAGVQPILHSKLQFATDADGSRTLSYEEETVKPGDGNRMTKTLGKDDYGVEKRTVTGQRRLLSMFLHLMRKLDKGE